MIGLSWHLSIPLHGWGILKFHNSNIWGSKERKYTSCRSISSEIHAQSLSAASLFLFFWQSIFAWLHTLLKLHNTIEIVTKYQDSILACILMFQCWQWCNYIGWYCKFSLLYCTRDADDPITNLHQALTKICMGQLTTQHLWVLLTLPQLIQNQWSKE